MAWLCDAGHVRERTSHFSDIQLSGYLTDISLRAVSTILGRPVMISHNPSTPLPQSIDDEHLVVESSICLQPPGLCSRVE